MEEIPKQPSSITMISYTITNDKREPTKDFEIIPKKKYRIGRSKKEADLVLNEKLLSRKHAELIYFDSKTIMVKDLESRNGTYIDKERISPLKETFFTSKHILSFGSTNNEIVFFDKNQQGKEIIESDYEKNKEKENNYEADNSKNKQNIEEEINTTLRKSYDKNIYNEKNKETYNGPKSTDNNYEKEREKEKEKEKEKESYQKKERYEENDSKYKQRSNSGSQIKNSRQIYRERNIEKSLSNRETYNNKNRKDDSFNNKKMKSYDRNDEYNYSNGERRSKLYSNKSRSISKEREYRSRSRSRETFQRRKESKRENYINPINREYRNYNYEKIRKREFEIGTDKGDQYREEEMRRKDERDREEYEYMRRKNEMDRYRDREEDEESMRRKEFGRKEMLDQDNEEELNYSMKIRAMNKKDDKSEYNDDRIRDDYKSTYDRITLNPEKIETLFSNKDNKNGSCEGFIRCYVSGYMNLNIKSLEYIKKLNKK